jgi:hypothetical protein
MFERVPVAGSPISATPAERQSAGNAAVQRMAPTLRHLVSPTPRALHRRPVRNEDDRLRAGSAALQRAVADRRMIARDQDPGPPQSPDWWGIVCGVKEGKPYCTVNTPKGELEVELEKLTPEQRAIVKDPARGNCPPQRWNWFWKTCCKPGEHFEIAQRHCAPDKKERPAPVQEEPWDIPPAPEQHPGDYPLPDEGQAYA